MGAKRREVFEALIEEKHSRLQKRILLAYNDEKVADTLSSILEGDGYQVEITQTGHEALQKAEKRLFNLAILDFMLPDISGDEVAIKLRNNDNKICLILVTERKSLQNCIDILNIGISEILLKPISPDELLRATKRAISTIDFQELDKEVSH